MEIKDFLDQKYSEYCKPDFIENDPVSIPHLFSKKEDIEISGFLTATISWGNRKMIIKNAKYLMHLMDNQPFDFIMNAGKNELNLLKKFTHRTFQSDDILFFTDSLRSIYRNENGMENLFTQGYKINQSVFSALKYFRTAFLDTEHLKRSEKHISDVVKLSSAKRLNMFLRWMIRSDAEGVDFGLWKNIPTAALMIPLDVHVLRVAHKLELLDRKQQDWKSVELLTTKLRELDVNDPVKYDYALFGLGVSGF